MNPYYYTCLCLQVYSKEIQIPTESGRQSGLKNVVLVSFWDYICLVQFFLDLPRHSEIVIP